MKAESNLGKSDDGRRAFTVLQERGWGRETSRRWIMNEEETSKLGELHPSPANGFGTCLTLSDGIFACAVLNGL